eukprot:4315850-Prymnesium_polylepis.1
MARARASERARRRARRRGGLYTDRSGPEPAASHSTFLQHLLATGGDTWTLAHTRAPTRPQALCTPVLTRRPGGHVPRVVEVARGLGYRNPEF